MVQRTQTKDTSVSNTVKILYTVGIGANLLITVAHISYTFIAYKTIDEPALWFFSGAVAVIFDAALNFLCLKEYTRFNYVTTIIVDLALFIFCVILAIVVLEVYTIFVAAILFFYTTVLCYIHNKTNAKKVCFG
jgi:hypothetical protein